MEDLTKILKILDIDVENGAEVEKVSILMEFVEQSLLVYINETSVPTQLQWIVNEATIQRYNLIGSEHLTSEGIGEVSGTFKENLIGQYADYLDSYIENQEKKKTNIKKVRMI